MKGGYIILDIKKCQFTLNDDESEYIANNNYAKNIIKAIWNTQKPVLVENLSALGSSYAGFKGSGFCKMDTSAQDYIVLALPDSGNETSIYFNINGTISIGN